MKQNARPSFHPLKTLIPLSGCIGLLVLTGCVNSQGPRERNRFEIRTKTHIEVRDSHTGETLVHRKLSGRVHHVNLRQKVLFSEYPDTLPTDGEEAIALLTDHLVSLPPAPVPQRPAPPPVEVVEVPPQPAPPPAIVEAPPPVKSAIVNVTEVQRAPIVRTVEPTVEPAPAPPAVTEPVKPTPAPGPPVVATKEPAPEPPAVATKDPAPTPAPVEPTETAEAVKPYTGQLKVKRAKDGNLTLSGSKSGLQPGTRFFVRDEQQTLTDPLTGEVHVLSEGDILGLAEVTEIGLFGIKGRLLSGDAKAGNRLEPKP